MGVVSPQIDTHTKSTLDPTLFGANNVTRGRWQIVGIHLMLVLINYKLVLCRVDHIIKGHHHSGDQAA